MAIEYYRSRPYNDKSYTEYTAVDMDTNRMHKSEYGGSDEYPTARLTVENVQPKYIEHFNPDIGEILNNGHHSIRNASNAHTDDYLHHLLAKEQRGEHTLSPETRKDIRNVVLYSPDAPESRKRLLDNPEVQPDTLFTTIREPRTEVHGMFSDPKMTSHAITLGALAIQDNRGQPIVAAKDLSKHSSKLSQHLVESGYPVVPHPHNPDMDVTNDLDFMEMGTTPAQLRRSMSSPSAERIHPTTVSSAKSMLRGYASEARKKRNTKPVTEKGLSDQFLPGMEGFV